jgi:methyl-accepting chemotaxis protein
MRTLTISQKLYSTVGALMTAGVILAAVSAWNLSLLTADLDKALNEDAIKLDRSNLLRARTWQMVAEMRATFLWASLKDDARQEAAIDAWHKTNKATHDTLTELIPLQRTDVGKGLLRKLNADLEVYEKVAQDYIKICRDRNLETIRGIAPRVAASIADMEKAQGDFRARQLALFTQAHERSMNLRTQSIWLNGTLTLLVICAGALALLAVRGINRNLRNSIRDLSEGGDQVAAASGQIAATSQSLSQGASQQAASLEEISASMEEMTAMSKRNSENSTEATGMMSQVAVQIDESNSALQEMVASMTSIKSSSEKVAKIIKTIDEIAFQTNILALNAAVEAARAGEAGMGFAVVADEVRNLAQRSAVAAKDTAGLIEEAIANSNLGAEKLDRVAHSIREITGSATRVRSLVDEVSESSKQQTLGINQSSTAVTQVSQVTQTAAASAEEGAAAAEELNAQAQNIRDLVQGLRLMVDGESAIGPSRRLAQTTAITSTKPAAVQGGFRAF